MANKIAVIGAGFSGLSAAAYAARQGNEVHVFEKNAVPGGRARQYRTPEGFTFDMGPSWYWMPDIFDEFFADFGSHSSDFYRLVSLNPQFEAVFADGTVSVPEKYLELRSLFDTLEPGAGLQLDRFMSNARFKYEVGMKDFVNKPCHSWTEFMSARLFKSALKLDLFTSFHNYVRRYFHHPWLISLMEFPVIFLGAAPAEIPALYSLLNYGGYCLGTHYPIGGFGEVIRAMQAVGKDQGVQFHFSSNVEEIIVRNSKAVGLTVNGESIRFDAVIASSDYHHTEQNLLKRNDRNYNDDYWKSRTFAPSCLIYYLGLNRRIPRLKHHTLFFEPDANLHMQEIYETPKWPTNPLFYVCCPSRTDDSVAPEGCENLFLLMPIATGLNDTEEIREFYFREMIRRIETHTETENLIGSIIYKRSYCAAEFVQDYNAYGGNAYGLANTLRQTAVLKPSMRNKKVRNLLYTGQLTVPGPGVPPSIVSGRIAAGELSKIKQKQYEKNI